ncbi:MAG: bifunctional riboflavin kinase/FAD synthetase [Candidatus Omnitrophica bacterium]|nr:bifunctional riboflavin kinase/FAD synthetase [Candidatus Omnitrophota bacterium]
MKVFRGTKDIENNIRDTIATIGVFDGVHIGHRRIIKEVVKRSKVLNLKSVVVTFDPHPLKVLNPSANVPSLASLEHRRALIAELGVDYLVILKFTRSLSKLSPEIFINNILIDKLSIKEIYVGENFYFGRGAKAGIETLKKWSIKFGFTVKVFKPIQTKGRIISSTLIRRLIVNGDIRKASHFLGRPVSILGTVVKGSSRGRIMGYPTANIDPHHEAIPPSGVYAVRVRYKNKFLKGILNIGVRPTFFKAKGSEEREPTIEVHIFGFDKRIYGEDIEVIFIKKLRDEKRFKDRYDLIRQIRRDERMARNILK